MGDLKQSFDKTKLDLENAKPEGFRVLDTITTYPALSTGTPTSNANPGAPQNYYQSYTPQKTYLENVPIRYSSSILAKSLDKTNLDTTDSKVDGGIPYKQIKDPTIYPTTTKKTGTVRGFSNIQGKGAEKFNQSFSLNKTYLDFIKPYI